ncbi:SHOCT domain-containing protein [Rhizobiales bacterium 3FA27D7]|jgi:hypothetical protein|uniref:SHOCT domain-containing protein n=1 Tax=Mesorhizobium sp. 2RAF21 TaxID=3232995 RepID=UPI0010F5EA13
MIGKEGPRPNHNTASAAPWLRALRALSLTARLVISLFLGTMIGVAGGALFPALTHIAAPLICSGKLETVSSPYSYKPGQYGVTRELFCVGDDGSRQPMTARGLFFSSLIYAVALFALWPLLMLSFRYLLSRGARRVGSYAEDRLRGFVSQETTTPTWARPIKGIRIETVRQPAPADTIEDRLRELARLRDIGAITPEDYETRKREMLSEL